MERGGDKHGARVDDALAHEMDGTAGAGRSSRVEQWLDPEPSGEDQPNLDLRPHGALPGGCARGDDRSGRGAAQRGGAGPGRGESYPASGAELVTKAQDSSATDRVLDRLERLRPKSPSPNVQDVSTSLGGGVEQYRS